jgi:hypothetical protein
VNRNPGNDSKELGEKKKKEKKKKKKRFHTPSLDVAQHSDCNLFTKTHRLFCVRAPMDSGSVASNCNVRGNLVELTSNCNGSSGPGTTKNIISNSFSRHSPSPWLKRAAVSTRNPGIRKDKVFIKKSL